MDEFLDIFVICIVCPIAGLRMTSDKRDERYIHVIFVIPLFVFMRQSNFSAFTWSRRFSSRTKLVHFIFGMFYMLEKSCMQIQESVLLRY